MIVIAEAPAWSACWRLMLRSYITSPAASARVPRGMVWLHRIIDDHRRRRAAEDIEMSTGSRTPKRRHDDLRLARGRLRDRRHPEQVRTSSNTGSSTALEVRRHLEVIGHA